MPVNQCGMQAKHTSEVVSPDEYDEAVRRDPMVSALAATGDLRTGRQLLAEAAADRLRSVGWMAKCPHGRAELNGIAAAAEILAKRLREEGGSVWQSHGVSS
jgi:hypothetical protein